MTTVPDRTKRIFLVVAAAVGMGLVFDWFFFDKLVGVSFPIYVVLTLAGLLLAARAEKRKLPNAALFMIPLLVFFSAMVYVRASGFVTFLNIVLSLYLLGLFVALTLRPQLNVYTFGDYFWLPFRVAGRVLARARRTLGELTLGTAFMRRHQALPQVLRGIIIALPVLILFVLLFASADLVFRHYVSDLFSFELNAELIWRTIIILLVAFGFVGLFGLMGAESADNRLTAHAAETPKPNGKHGGLVEVLILFGSLNALFLCFISIQLAYLFGGIHNVVGSGFTYAEYARKGFFELIAVATLSFVLIFITERLLLRQTERHDLRFKLLAGALVAQVIIIMISAFKRLGLYEGAYGFTSLRLFAHIFLIWLTAVLGLLLYKIFADKRESAFAFALFASVLVLIGTINVLNVDAYVAHKNIERYNATGKLDVRYLRELSSDAVPETARLLDAKDVRVRQNVAYILYQKQFALRPETKRWQSANAGRAQAVRVFNDHATLLEQNKDLPIQDMLFFFPTTPDSD